MPLIFQNECKLFDLLVNIVIVNLLLILGSSFEIRRDLDGHSRRQAWIKDTVSSNVTCANEYFICGSKECISKSMVCDGVVHCYDGSDEKAEMCVRGRRKRAVAAVSRSCTIPKNNAHRSYSVVGRDGKMMTVRPGGTVAKYATLSLQCDDGYLFEDGRNSMDSLCNYKGVWSLAIQDCIKTCKPLKPENVKLICTYKKETIGCIGPLLASTTVKPMKCESPFHEEFKPNYSFLTCKTNGEWDRILYKCLPDCGRPSHSTTLIVKGIPAVFGASPWHVAIYDVVNYSPFHLICGGTIVSPLMIISAAHCFYNVNKRIKENATNYEIVVGKVTRDYNHNDSALQKTYKVKEIHFSSEKVYLPDEHNHASDIAVLQLERPITFNHWVLPACIAWTERRSFRPKHVNNGRLVGWGVDERGKLTGSEILLAAELPYMDYNACKAKGVEVDFDKFCAGSDDGSGAHEGDSGGGLMFKNEDNLYYLRGIVSTRNKYPDLSIATFTDLTYHIDWLNQINQKLQAEVLQLKDIGNTVAPLVDRNGVSSSTVKPKVSTVGSQVNKTDGNANITGSSGTEHYVDGTTFDSSMSTLLIDACRGRRLDLVEFYLENKADINFRNHLNQTALCNSAYYGPINIVKYLVERGANVNARGQSNHTPLMNAVAGHHLDIVQYLTEKKADINAQSAANDTALHWAIFNNVTDIFMYLIEKGANLELKGANGSTPLVYAVRKNRVHMVHVLVERNADINATDKMHYTSLMWAAFSGFFDTVKYLVENGADLNIVGENGATAVSVATKKGYSGIAQYLLAKKVVMDSKT